MNKKQNTILVVMFLFCFGCASAPRQPINMEINAVFASKNQVNVIKCKPENVYGFYVRAKNTIVITMPRDWHDYRAMQTIGHEVMEIFYGHKEDHWLPGKGQFLEQSEK